MLWKKIQENKNGKPYTSNSFLFNITFDHSVLSKRKQAQNGVTCTKAHDTKPRLNT